MKISVVVPSWRRADDLARCLGALRTQRRRADQVVVVLRPDDHPAAALADGREPHERVEVVRVDEPGQVAALNAGVAAARGDVVAITDDDTAPRADWLERIERHLNDDPSLAGVGGRDLIRRGELPDARLKQAVGRVQPWGRIIGNHHLGTGGPRYVDVLKGCNMSFRRAALGDAPFDQRLEGTGAQLHNDLALCLELRRHGWKLLYDPLVAVEHYPAERPDGERDAGTGATLAEGVSNETVAVLGYFGPLRRLLFSAWALLIGTGYAPGLAQAIRLILRRERSVWRRLLSAQTGRLHGWLAFLRR